VASRVELPDKLYFKIGEVTRLTGVKQHVLRYWESEFPSIRPQKSKSNQRLYRRRDVEAVLAIRHLLYDRKYTIEGAKKELRDRGVETSLPPPDPEALVKQARGEAEAHAFEKEQQLRASLKREREKQLLALRSEVVAFLSELGDS
jgi:DNA-binding transcriptional MerR regulator